MHQLLPHLLWIGHAGDGRDFSTVFENNIQALLYLAAEEPLPQVPRELMCLRFPLVDGAGNPEDMLYLAISTLAALVKRQVPTLATCGAGLSRSPAVAAAAFSIINQRPPAECLAEIRKQHPCDVSPALWAEIAHFLTPMEEAKEP